LFQKTVLLAVCGLVSEVYSGSFFTEPISGFVQLLIKPFQIPFASASQVDVLVAALHRIEKSFAFKVGINPGGSHILPKNLTSDTVITVLEVSFKILFKISHDFTPFSLLINNFYIIHPEGV